MFEQQQNLGRRFSASKMHLSHPPPPPTHTHTLPVACAAARSRAAVLLLLIYCLMYFPLIVEVLCLSLFLFCYALHYVHSSFTIILKRKLVALLFLSYRCIVTIIVLWLFLTVPRVGLQCVIVVFPDHTHLVFNHFGFKAY